MLERRKTLAWALMVALGMSACGDDDGDDDVGDGGRPDAGLDGSITRDGGLDASGDGAAKQDAALDGAGPRQAVSLRFKAKIGAQDLVCGQAYPGQGSSNLTVTPQDFRFFVQEVRLVSASGREVPLEFDQREPFQTHDVALLDFTTGEGACTSGSPMTNMVISGQVEPGEYSGVVLVVGVPESLNHGNPASAPAPLRAPGSFWDWTLGYRFLMAELVQASGAMEMDAGVDAGAPDAGAPDAGAPGATGLGFIHLGSTACTGDPTATVTCAHPNRAQVRLTGFNPASASIVADLGAIFATADLRAAPQCHGSGASCAPMFQALGVDLTTGAALPTQQVFRVE